MVAPPFASIEEYLGRNTRAYYDVLADVGQGAWNPERDARPWIRFCLTAHFRQAKTLHRRTRQIERIYDELEAVVVRKYGLPERAISSLADAALGLRIRNPSYRKAADVSDTVASRDLKALTESGLLIAKGEKRGRYYEASPTVVEIRERVAEPKAIADPFIDPSVLQPH
jgi:DNA-binding transcriptional ArsR family regulator